MPDISIQQGDEIIVSPKVGFRILSLIIKMLIAIVSIGFIYHEIVFNKDLIAIKMFAVNMFTGPADFVLLFTVLLLMFVNWTIESVKWRFLIGKIERISLFKAVKAIFSGTSISVFTPNRIGDFGGRVLYLDQCDRFKAIFITVLGSISQSGS